MGNVSMKSIWDECEGLSTNLWSTVSRSQGFPNQGSNLGLLGFRLAAGLVGVWWWSTKRDEGCVVVSVVGGWLFYGGSKEQCARLEFRLRGLRFRQGVAGVVKARWGSVGGGNLGVVVNGGGLHSWGW